jgi:branched-subunit amino acid transport protein
MSITLVGLAVLMFAVTYPSRALPLLVPGIDRLPAAVLDYLRLVGPSTLAALAAANTILVPTESGGASLRIGIEWLAVAACLAVVSRWRRLLPGLAVAIVVAALARTLGLG